MLTGNDQPVIDFLERETQANLLVEDIQRFLQRWLPAFLLDQRASITVAIGCTGGRHRSIYIADQLGERFASEYQVVVRHRDIKWLEGPARQALRRGAQARDGAGISAADGALSRVTAAAAIFEVRYMDMAKECLKTGRRSRYASSRRGQRSARPRCPSRSDASRASPIATWRSSASSR